MTTSTAEYRAQPVNKLNNSYCCNKPPHHSSGLSLYRCTAGSATSVSHHQYAAAASKQSASFSGMRFGYCCSAGDIFLEFRRVVTCTWTRLYSCISYCCISYFACVCAPISTRALHLFPESHRNTRAVDRLLGYNMRLFSEVFSFCCRLLLTSMTQ